MEKKMFVEQGTEWTTNINIMGGSANVAPQEIPSPVDHAFLVRIAVGSEATVVPVSGTEGVRDLPDIQYKPDPWMANMIP